MKWFGRAIYTPVNGTETDDHIEVDQISFTSSCSSENDGYQTANGTPKPDLISFDEVESRAESCPLSLSKSDFNEDVCSMSPSSMNQEKNEDFVSVKESEFVRDSIFWFHEDEVDRTKFKLPMSNRGRVSRFENDVNDDNLETMCRSLQVTIGLAERYKWLNNVSKDPILSALIKELDPEFPGATTYGQVDGGEDYRDHAPSTSSMVSLAGSFQSRQESASSMSDAGTFGEERKARYTRIHVMSRPGIDAIELRRKVNNSCELVCTGILKHALEIDMPRDKRLNILMNRYANAETWISQVRPTSRKHDKYAFEVPALLEDWILHVHKQPNIRNGLETQQWKCAACRQLLYAQLAEKDTAPKYCEYYGYYFCHLCHSGEKSIIPSKIFSAWNFTEVPVCDRALRFLRAVQDVPVFRLREIAPETLKRNKALRNIIELRIKLKHMEQFIKVCAYASAQVTEFGNLGTMFASLDRYLLETDDLFSMNDLLRVYNKDLINLLEPLAKLSKSHILECKGCCSRAHVCVKCNELSDRLFPFEERVHRCNGCGGLSHAPKCPRRDVPKDSACPKCARIMKTRSKQRILSVGSIGDV